VPLHSRLWGVPLWNSVFSAVRFKKLDHRVHGVSTENTPTEEILIYRIILFNLIRDHSLNFGRIGIADQRRSAELALALLVFRGQDVAQKCFRALHFSCTSLFEALGRAFVCL
jgi:hypothetical protein